MSAPSTTPPVVRLILARHGEAEGSREYRFNGSSDVPLTQHGVAQARLLADALYPLAPVAVYSSPLARARATAEAIASRANLAVEIQPNLREQSYGSWERLTADEARQRDPKRFAAWSAGQRIAPPAGETLSAVRQRVVACVCELAERHAGETVVLVAHVGPIKALLCAALGLPLSGARRFWIDPASYSVVDWRVTADGQLRLLVRSVNVVSHLSGLPRLPAS
jgi:broad specificity phosphatase PhoE